MPSLLRLCKPLAIALLLLGPLPALAQAERTLTVTGEGIAAAVPDQAEVQAGVVTEGATAAQALAANSAAMEQVFAALGAAGIPETRMQTSNLSVQPVFAPPRPDQRDSQRITGYRVSNTVSVRVEDLAKLGPLLDALVRTGANELFGVSFSIANPKPLLDAARKGAVADAQARAQTLAAAAGVRLGLVISVQEGQAEVPRPMLRSAQAMDFAAVPVAAGEQSVRAGVTMVFRIED